LPISANASFFASALGFCGDFFSSLLVAVVPSSSGTSVCTPGDSAQTKKFARPLDGVNISRGKKQKMVCTRMSVVSEFSSSSITLRFFVALIAGSVVR
jgi:hypothetical protein